MKRYIGLTRGLTE